MFASIVVNVKSSNVDQMFEYLIPKELEEFAAIGSRVNVAFGIGNRLVMGYILDLYDEKRFEGENRTVVEILDLKPLITKTQLQMANFLKDDTICPLATILNMMIPKALLLKTYKYIVVKNATMLDATLVNAFGGKQILELNSSLNEYQHKIKKELANGNLTINYEMKQPTNYKYLKQYSVNMPMYFQYRDTIKNPLKKEFLDLYKDSEYLTETEIIDHYDVSLYMIKSLIKDGFLETKKTRVLRIKKASVAYTKPSLTSVLPKDDQTLEKLLNSTIPSLYMPSSTDEKNEILLKLIGQMLEQNKNTVVLCADILSSFKYASLIRKTLGVSVACLNSNLSAAEELDYYTEILENNYQVVVTTPKCAFFPYQNVGMYFMMNEESDNYFNDQSPRYDLHKAIYYLAKLTNALFIMESISPSVANYCYALKGTYKIVDNTKDVTPALTTVVNMIDELKRGNNTYLSKRLEDVIINNYKQNKQSLLIVNNKNYSNYLVCLGCGDVPKCNNCNISLNYNEKTEMLVCPACGKRMPYSEQCNKCGSTKKRFGGIGIERIKKQLDEKLPMLKTLVIDQNDSLDTFAEQMSQIEDQLVDVIVTTENYAKAIVNHHLGLVAIINFDSVLKTPSYDAMSRAYNMLKSCGELVKKQEGMMIVQTTDINNYPLVNYISGEYHEFLKTEIANRKLMHNIPFYHINRIIVKANYEEMFVVANNIKNMLKNLAGSKIFIIGPTYSKKYSGAVIIIKHNYSGINQLYKTIYEYYQSSQAVIIFDKYPRKL